MNRATAAVLLTLAMAMAGCETTGDPREGGLFGWSETKAISRREAKLATLAEVEHEREAQRANSTALHSHEMRTEAQIAADRSRYHQAAMAVDTMADRVLAKAVKLEQDCFTPATASGARRLRSAVESARADPRLSPEQRVPCLQALDAKIDAARKQFGL